MKKITLLAILLFFGTVSSVYALPALPLWSESITIEGFTVRNESDPTVDSFNEVYYGYTGTGYSGYYLGTIEGNTNNGSPSRLQQIITYYYQELFDAVIQFTEQLTVEFNGSSTETVSGSFGTLTVTATQLNDDSEPIAGTWGFAGQDYGLGFYAVKGANEFALYFVDPAQSDGFWTTRHLLTPNGDNTPEISHFTFSAVPMATSVPEPSTVMLLGAGLVGLAFYGRKRLQG